MKKALQQAIAATPIGGHYILRDYKISKVGERAWIGEHMPSGYCVARPRWRDALMSCRSWVKKQPKPLTTPNPYDNVPT